jgi:Leucine-rich repeat (LRR) protein
MWLPPELAMQVGSYLDPHDLRVCTTQLCSSGAEFVSAGFKKDTTTIRLHGLVACCRLTAGVDDVAQECIERIESFLTRRGSVQTIIVDAELRFECATNASVYSDFHSRLQQGSSYQLSHDQGITVEWHVKPEYIAQIEFLLCADVPKDGVGASDSSAGGAIRQYLHTMDLSGRIVSDVSVLASCTLLHTLDLSSTPVRDVSVLAYCKSLHTVKLYSTNVRDVSVLASCQSLHTLDLNGTLVRDVSVLAYCKSLHTVKLCSTNVSDVSVLASCQNLHTLALSNTQVSEVSVLAYCKSLHTLDLSFTYVSDVSTLASCKSLHTLNLNGTQVSDVSVLASCQNLHTLNLWETEVRDVSALASCQSLHALNISETQVSDVSALASCQSLSELEGVEDMIGGSDVLQIIQDRG